MIEPIKLKAIQFAIATLTNLGCKFKVIDPTGAEHGDLPTFNPAEHTQKHNYLETGYRELVNALHPGESIFVPWADKSTLSGLRSSMMSRGIRSFGKGSVISEMSYGDSCGVRILRQF